MPDITHVFTYIFMFASLNFEVFLLITYFENRLDIKAEGKAQENVNLKKYPSVTIIVPCWNEENTVSKTIHSILNLNYPKDKLKIMVVDDGSEDNTWSIVQGFKNNPQIELYKKENGGKYTALNFGLNKTTTDLVGCLDADSYVHKDSMKKIALYFENKDIMAVAPSIKLWQPKGPLQLFQKVEYGFATFTRKMFHYMQAVYITPGPFSIFRKSVFDTLGGYKYAHGTEDIEIALRMQKNGYKIAHAHNAVIYTISPNTLRKLLKQRIRWSYGLIKNTIDYRGMFFKRKYGNLGVFILPMAVVPILSILTIACISIFNFGYILFNEFERIKTVGLNFSWDALNFDWFYVNTELISFITIATILGTLIMIYMSKKMSEGKFEIGMDLFYFMTLYMFIAPVWIGKAIFNSLFSIKATWR